MVKELDEEKKDRVCALAEKLRLLFAFCADLIPDRDLLEETLASCRDRQSTVEGGAAILATCGIDYEKASLEARIRKERSVALLNLIETLERTEKERMNYEAKEASREVGRAELRKILGM